MKNPEQVAQEALRAAEAARIAEKNRAAAAVLLREEASDRLAAAAALGTSAPAATTSTATPTATPATPTATPAPAPAPRRWGGFFGRAARMGCLGLIFVALLVLVGGAALVALSGTPASAPTAAPTQAAVPTSTPPTAMATPTTASALQVTPDDQEAPAAPAEAAAQAAQAQCRNTDFFDQAVNPPGGVIDVVLVGGEPCAATWRSAGTGGGGFEGAICPTQWVCTFSTSSGTQVFQGTGQVIDVNGATWRPLAPSFCEVLGGEQDFASRQTPPFPVSAAPGSPSCAPK